MVGFWLVVAWLALQGESGHRLVRFATVMLITHTLELPLVFRQLKSRGAATAPVRVVVMTILFGLTWWVPARRGVFALR